MGLHRCVAALTALTALGASVAAAQTPPTVLRARLRWQVDPAAAGCPGALVFRREVARRLGVDPFTDDAASGVAIDIAADGAAALLGTVQPVHPDGSTTPTPPVRVGRGRCVDLVTVLAGRTAVYLESGGPTTTVPDAAAPADVVAPTPDAAPAMDATDATDLADAQTPPDARTATSTDAPPAVTSTARWRFEPGAGVVGAWVGEGAWALGAWIDVRGRFRALALGAEAAALGPVTDATPSAGVSLRATTARVAVSVCALPWRASLCAVAGVSFTSLALRAPAGEGDREPLLTYGFVGPRAGVDVVRVGALALSVRAEALWSPSHAVLRFADGAQWGGAWQLGAGLGARWVNP